MKAKRHPARGPLLTFALMIGSIAAVNAIGHYLDSHRKPAEPTVAASSSAASNSRPAAQQ